MARATCSRARCAQPVVGRKLCRKHYQAAWKAGDFVNAPLPPRVAGRTICPDGHKHAGSSTCYIQHQCRCVPCKEAHSAMAQRRVREKAYGRFDTGLVDAEPVREHMLLLGEFGLGYKRVAGLAGIGITAVRNVLLGRQEPGPRYGELPKRIKRANAEAILAVKPDLSNLAAGANIPSRGFQRRAQALVRRGYSVSAVGAFLGIEPANFHGMMHRTHVFARTHLAMADLFDRLWDVEPAQTTHHERQVYSRAINYAKARRWLPPLAWDDIDSDIEPPVQTDEGGMDEMAIELATSGEVVRLSHDERREAVTRLCLVKLNDQEIARRLHIADRTVLRIRQELGIAASVGADRMVAA
jgi:hypothetical protein